jgi:hypothetical protein
MPTLPAPGLPTPAGADSLLVGMARIDRSGRLHERHLLRILGWTPGHRLTLDVAHDLIVVRPAPTGPHILDHRGALHLPAAARHMCGIHPGPPVVLAASLADDVLVIHPAELVARLLATHYADATGAHHER